VSDASFPVTVRDGMAIVTTPAEIDISNAVLLRGALLAAAAAHQPVLIVDMTGTEFCDSTGLNVLVRAYQQAELEDKLMRLVVGGPALRRILSVTGVGGMFRVYESLTEALAPV
jgi:anti-sigma B factor antagonist